MWNEGVPLKIADEFLESSYVESEVLRSIHIGLLCLQRHADDRPDMTSVVIMLSSEGVLPEPKEPGFLLESIPVRGESATPSSHTPKPSESSLLENKYPNIANETYILLLLIRKVEIRQLFHLLSRCYNYPQFQLLSQPLFPGLACQLYLPSVKLGKSNLLRKHFDWSISL